MKIGCCVAVKDFKFLLKTECDYIEANLSEVSALSETNFNELKDLVDDSPIKCESFNCLLTQDFIVIGNLNNQDKIREYLKKALSRASQLGGKIIVFGSGFSRNIPQGFSKESAEKQIVEFLKMASDIAFEYNLTFAIEPLRKEETNFINYLTDAKHISTLVDRDNIKILADLFHIYCLKEPLSNINLCGDVLKHIHIANPISRNYPTLNDGYDYTEFFIRLKEIGYNSRISIEGITNEIVSDFTKSMELFKYYHF